jgi:hypothetical protein
MGLGRVWKRGSLVVIIGELWDFAPLVENVGLIDCNIVFYIVVVCCVMELLKCLIISVNNLLVTFWVGNSGELKYFS